jgi:hypothetical protein
MLRWVAGSERDSSATSETWVPSPTSLETSRTEKSCQGDYPTNHGVIGRMSRVRDAIALIDNALAVFSPVPTAYN